jgi:PKD repeat protein
MKKTTLLLGCAFLALFILPGCEKDIENAIDCVGESILVDVKHTTDSTDPKTITFTVSYSGDHKLDNTVKWNFGDGTNQTATGTSVTHTYATAGDYTAIATVKLINGGSSCSPEVKENVTIN